MNAEPERPKRLSLSAIVEMLLTRSTGERSTVSISRNRAGEYQIDVKVGTGGEDGDVHTVEDAERKAAEVFERLEARFPMADAHPKAEATLTRNAKGDTQISMSQETSPEHPTLEAVLGVLQESYDKSRREYPMESGYTAKPGSVK